MPRYSQIKNFLRGVSSVESDDNPNAQHKPAESGVLEDQTAVGQYGMMPGTAIQMAKEAKDGSPVDDLVRGADPGTVSELLKADPRLQQYFSEKLAEKVLNKSDGDNVDAYYRWRWGQNTPDDKVDELKARTPALENKVQDRFDSVAGNSEIFPQVPELEDAIQSRTKPSLYNPGRMQFRGIASVFDKKK